MLIFIYLRKTAYQRCNTPHPGLEIVEQDTTMASTKQEGTAADAEQLGSSSLSGSEERKDDETKPTPKNGTPMCSECGKKSNTLKKCNGCRCVWYCDKKCQNKHRKEHKHECRAIKIILDERGGKVNLGTELDVGPLGKVPQQEECPICMLALPIHPKLQGYAACCGKTICCGCMYQNQEKSQERPTCAFCREPILGESDKETLARALKRVEQKDPNALLNMALKYGFGQLGLSVDQAKCIELVRRSADLGCPGAQYQLAVFHKFGQMGLEQNEEEAFKNYKEAAENGHIFSHNNIGSAYLRNGDFVAAMRHWRLSAAGGLRSSIKGLIQYGFEDGFLQHGDLAETLQAFYWARAEMKSEGRDDWIAYLKRNGEYSAEYDL